MVKDAKRIQLAVAGMVIASTIVCDAAAQFSFDMVQDITICFDFDMYPTCVAAGDLNNDGWLDYVISGRNADVLSAIFFGSATGIIPQPNLFSVGGQTDWVELRDFDGDGNLDIAFVVRSFPGYISVLINASNGVFPTQTDYPAGRSPTCLIAEDLDGDGDCDLAVTNNLSDSVTVYHNTGDGTFVVAQTVQIGQGLTTVAHPFYMIAADFDNDLDMDLAVGHLTSRHISFLMNNGDGTFPSPQVSDPSGTPVALAAADMNRDGSTDLVMTDMTGFVGRIKVFANDQTGHFPEATETMIGGWTWFITTPDLNGDGYSDVALTRALDGDLKLIPNPANGSLQFGLPDTIGGFDFPRHMIPIDIDADCDIDLVMVDIGAHCLNIIRNNTPQAGGCASADQNGDGAIDIHDVLRVLAMWDTIDRSADINIDGRVDIEDLLFVLGHWN